MKRKSLPFSSDGSSAERIVHVERRRWVSQSRVHTTYELNQVRLVGRCEHRRKERRAPGLSKKLHGFATRCNKSEPMCSEMLLRDSSPFYISRESFVSHLLNKKTFLINRMLFAVRNFLSLDVCPSNISPYDPLMPASAISLLIKLVKSMS